MWAKISISLVIRVIKDNLHMCDFYISLGSVKINVYIVLCVYLYQILTKFKYSPFPLLKRT